MTWGTVDPFEEPGSWEFYKRAIKCPPERMADRYRAFLYIRRTKGHMKMSLVPWLWWIIKRSKKS